LLHVTALFFLIAALLPMLRQQRGLMVGGAVMVLVCAVRWGQLLFCTSNNSLGAVHGAYALLALVCCCVFLNCTAVQANGTLQLSLPATFCLCAWALPLCACCTYWLCLTPVFLRLTLHVLQPHSPACVHALLLLQFTRATINCWVHAGNVMRLKQALPYCKSPH
jgi:hypothetical protein